MADIRDKEVKKVTVVLPENPPVDLNFERMLKSFIKKVQKDGVLEEVKRRRYYIKKSEQLRMEKKNNRRNK